MKNVFLGLLAVICVGVGLFVFDAYGNFPDSGSGLLSRANKASPLEGIGSVINKTKGLLVAVYDFSVEGGAVGTIYLLDDEGNPAILPRGAVVTNVVVSTLTTLASGGATNVSIGVLNTQDLLGVTAKGTLAAPGFDAGTPVGTAATWVGPVADNGGTQVYMTIYLNALTAGKMKIFIEYVCQ